MGDIVDAKESYKKVCDYFYQNNSTIFQETSSRQPGVLNWQQTIFICQVASQASESKSFNKVKFQNIFHIGRGQYNGKVAQEISLEEMIESAKKITSKFIMEELFLKKQVDLVNDVGVNFFQLYRALFPNIAIDKINFNSVWEKVKNIKQLPTHTSYQEKAIKKDNILRFEICAMDYLRSRFLDLKGGEVANFLLTMRTEDGKVQQRLGQESKNKLLLILIDDAQKLSLPSGLNYDTGDTGDGNPSKVLFGEICELFLERPELLEKDQPFYNILVKENWLNVHSVVERMFDSKMNYNFPFFQKIIYNLIVIGGPSIAEKIGHNITSENLTSATSKHQEIRREFVDFLFSTFSFQYPTVSLPRDLCKIISDYYH